MAIEYKVVAGLLGGAATMITQKIIRTSWKAITGEEPPDPNDPDASTVAAVSWVAASAVGVAIAQVIVNRLVAKRYQDVGHHTDTSKTIKATVK